MQNALPAPCPMRFWRSLCATDATSSAFFEVVDDRSLKGLAVAFQTGYEATDAHCH